jgi:preprotein translocase subunit SecA
MPSLSLDSTVTRDFYPERAAPPESPLDRMMVDAWGNLGRLHGTRLERFQSIVPAVKRAGEGLERLGEEELKWQVQALRQEMRTRGFAFELVSRAFALVRELSERRLKMRHFDVQLMGGWVLLNGMVAEMQTGEGKTLTATLPACALALGGIPVHIITVNDYLAERDAAWMAPLYQAFGLKVGAIVHGMGLEERRQAYRCDVTYCTNKEVVFDYLRDRLELGQRPGPVRMRLERLYGTAARFDRLRLRGLFFGIVDEADSVLIDEARTPLIIAGPGSNNYEAEIYRQAMALADRLESMEDYKIDFLKRTVEWTDEGRAHLAEIAPAAGPFWAARLRREDLVRTALTARHLFQRDRHYVLKDGKVNIVDEYTGRLMPGRSWEGGLHQLIETKEGCEVTVMNETLGRISYQRFFRRYLHLAGMTGTAREGAREFWSVYRLAVVSIPTNRPMRREALPLRIYRRAHEKWAAVVARITELHAAGRPVLVGTRTVAASEHLARLLAEAGLSCRVLNALQDAYEASIVAQAGQRGQITVATNMAGRGTDILLGEGVRELGGLHVIATELHDARRIDRQLFGRCGRQGDPGSHEAFVSLEDELIKALPARLRAAPGIARSGNGSAKGGWLGKTLFRRAQRAAERTHFLMRRDLLKMDESLDSALAFSGRGE